MNWSSCSDSQIPQLIWSLRRTPGFASPTRDVAVAVVSVSVRVRVCMQVSMRTHACTRSHACISTCSNANAHAYSTYMKVQLLRQL